MKITTAYPIIIDTQRVSPTDYYLNLDGSSSSDEIKKFQDWLDSKHPGWVRKDGKWTSLNKGSGYGVFGPSTSAAVKSFGNEYDAENLASSTTSTTVPATGVQTQAQIDSMKKKGFDFDKAKGVYTKFKDQGGVQGVKDKAKGILDMFGFGSKDSIAPVSTDPVQTTPDAKQPMSTTTKVLIGLSGVALLGTIIYFATRKKK